MADQFTYQKKRKEFGRHAQFEDTETKIVGSVIPNHQQKEIYQLRDPNKIIFDNIPQFSEHRVNTERVATSNRGMKHVVGGWPKDYDYTEVGDVQKYQKKLNRDPALGFGQASKDLVAGAQKCIRQNNEIDLFEEYFSGEQPEHLSETISTKTVMIFKDPNPVKRAVTKIAWHPESTTDLRVGVAYAMLRFQQMPPRMPLNSYIWNLNNPNFPERTLQPQSALCTMVFNPKNSEVIVGGSYNGSLAFFDQRKGSSNGVIKPAETTLLEKSHHDPVYDIYWLVGKTGTECVSTSTDGRLLWWDMKKLGDGPVDELVLSEQFQVNDQPVTKILGGTSLEYNQDAGPLKYLIGTEQGYILQANKRKAVEIQTRFGMESGKHHGPVYALQRNPAHTKFFMSVGDWTAKIWSEELKTPIMQTRYHNSYLTNGCWSPTRCGLFFLTRMDGFMDVWDFYYRQNEVAYSQKISDSPLTSISVMQSMAAIGDAEGTVSMMSLCRSLYDQTIQPEEKAVMASIFDREFKREKNLEQAKRQADMKKPVKKDNSVQDKKVEKMNQMLNDLEEQFFKQVAEDQDALATIKQRGAHLDDHSNGHAQPKAQPKEEVKQQQQPAAQQQKPAAQQQQVPQQQHQQQVPAQQQPPAQQHQDEEQHHQQQPHHEEKPAHRQETPVRTPSQHSQQQNQDDATSAVNKSHQNILILPIGTHTLQGTYQRADGESVELQLTVQVEEGGFIQLSQDDQDRLGYNVNGFQQDATISFKVQFANQKEVEFNGEFDSNKLIIGGYKTEADDNYDAEGSFNLVVLD